MDARSGGGRVSSLRDDLNSRAYASELPGYGAERSPAGEPVVPCAVCGEDEIPLNDDGECARCAPREDETCSEWLERTREIRRTK